ncbi:MAG: response regulator transcription factor [Desulfobacterales bacterium]|nr:response regulator transcription factor [Desulfobacterales bacterium]
MKKTTIILVDDHTIVRSGLKTIIQVEPGNRYKVVAEAGSFEQGLELIQQYQPDIAVIDIELAGSRDGIELTQEISDSRTRAVICSIHQNFSYISRSFKAGAKGYIKKDSMPDDIYQCLASVSEGRVYIDRTLKDEYEEIGRYMNAPAGKETEVLSISYGKLTRREQAVFRMVAFGQSTGEISMLLNISPSTANTHLRNIFSKLGVNSREGLLRHAVTIGIISSENIS